MLVLQRMCHALDDFLEGGRRHRAFRIENPAVLAWRSEAALAHAALGQAEPAQALASEEVELARAFGAPRALGVGLRALGLVTGGDRGISVLRDAVRTLQASEARLEHARALVDLGSALRRAQQRMEARSSLRLGLDLADRCQATALAERAQKELAATGARPRRRSLAGPSSLTASERRIAEMASTGMTNNQIAQSLFVTLRTVEMHLSNVYRKLRIASRASLGEALREKS